MLGPKRLGLILVLVRLEGPALWELERRHRVEGRANEGPLLMALGVCILGRFRAHRLLCTTISVGKRIRIRIRILRPSDGLRCKSLP